MVDVTTTGDPATGVEPAPVRLDRPVLIANLVSGALWLSPWFVAVALWGAVLVGTSFQNAVWHYIAWRSGGPTIPA